MLIVLYKVTLKIIISNIYTYLMHIYRFILHKSKNIILTFMIYVIYNYIEF